MKPRQRTRAAGIVIADSRVALIKRDRNRRGKAYYIYPGGGVEKGESPEETAAREVLEETGLEIEVERLVAVVNRFGNEQFHFLARIIGGRLGTGTGPEMTGSYSPESGTYEAVWMEIGDLLVNPVYPPCVGELIVEASVSGWPSAPIRCVDEGD